jgi:hypothetical protein
MTERTVRGIAGFLILVSLLLAHFVNYKWILLTAFVGLILFLSALMNWCPMMAISRKCGMKS